MELDEHSSFNVATIKESDRNLPNHQNSFCKAELVVFSKGGPKQNTRSYLTAVSETLFMLFHMVPSVLLSMAASMTTYFKESDWLLKNLHQSENG